MAFTDSDSYSSHMDEHASPENHDESMYEVDGKPYLCHEDFTNQNDFLHHKKTFCLEATRTLTELDAKPHLTEYCNETFTDMNSLIFHKEHHEFRQEVEDEESSTKMGETDMKSELLNSASHGCENYQGFYVCSHASCASIFENEEDLKSHLLDEHATTEIAAGIKAETEILFQAQRTVEQQLKNHDMTANIRKNPQKSGNFRNHSGGKLHTCDECGKGFKKRSNLNRHLSIHSEKKTF